MTAAFQPLAFFIFKLLISPFVSVFPILILSVTFSAQSRRAAASLSSQMPPPGERGREKRGVKALT